MERLHKILLIHVPTSICNFRCTYCYIGQRSNCYQGKQAQMKYTPEQVGYALRKERIGGTCYFNICGEGETLLTKDIDKYIHEIVKQGHYGEIVTNLTPTSMINKILSWDKDELTHIEFKCSFHYLELKKHNLLNTFVENVNKIWDAGASANIELCPSDELIPYIDEIKEFSIENFGALPHLTILRNDKTKSIEMLTKLSKEEYYNTWKDFNSNFWEFKISLFGIKQTHICNAGIYSVFINLATGSTNGCYSQKYLGNIFENPETKFPEISVGQCKFAHCYNCHALMSLGLIGDLYQDTHYGDLRDREKIDGTRWLNPELKEFFNQKVGDE